MLNYFPTYSKKKNSPRLLHQVEVFWHMHKVYHLHYLLPSGVGTSKQQKTAKKGDLQNMIANNRISLPNFCTNFIWGPKDLYCYDQYLDQITFLSIYRNRQQKLNDCHLGKPKWRAGG